MAVIYLCPADKRLLCSWEGYATEIKQHFENEHNELLFRTNSVEIELHKLPQNKLLYLDEELYLMQNYVDNEKLFIKLRYLGTNEAASRLHYNIYLTVNQISYRYDPDRYFSSIVPSPEHWEVDLSILEKYHGKLESLQCTVLLDTFPPSRRISTVSLKINNSFVEKNVCDETLENMLDDLSYLNDKLEKLKQEKRENSDIMDRISQLNFPILEEPFHSKDEEYKNDVLSQVLPNIPKELNLACSSCHMDMLPPIYLCSNGHNVCSSCRSKSCKICECPVTTNRNTELENISRNHLHQCRYFQEGCSEKLRYNELRAHEAKCYFCKYKCMSNCPYEGKFDSFLNHLKIVHSSIKRQISTKFDFPKNSELYVANKSVGIFYCKSEICEDYIMWRATFCGPAERHFFCELNFKGSKYKDSVFLKRRGNVFETRKPLSELKKNKAKDKYACLSIVSYDN